MLLVDKGRANNDSDEAKRADLSNKVTEKQNTKIREQSEMAIGIFFLRWKKNKVSSGMLCFGNQLNAITSGKRID